MKIMFVCHGNICRSPMAEFIMKNILQERRRSDITVCSSATSEEEIWQGVGNPMYPPAQEELKRHNIPYSFRRATKLKKEDYGEYDMFIGMDRANVNNMRRIFGADPDGKIHLLMSFTKRGGEVADPWYSRRFDIAFNDIYEGCTALLEYIL